MLTEVKIQLEANDVFVEFLKESPETKSKMIFLGYTLYQQCKQQVCSWDKSDYQQQLQILQDKITQQSQQLTSANSRHSEELSEITHQVKERIQATYQEQINDSDEKCKQLQQQLNDIQVKLLKEHQEEMARKLDELRSVYESKLDDERNKVLKCVSIQENSSIKGQQGEEFTFHQLNLLFPKYQVEDTHSQDARGDFLVKTDKCIMMVEAKQYNKNVPLVEIEKFHRDMTLEVNKDIHCGVLISLDSGICAKDDFHMEFIGGKPVIYLHHTRDQMYHIRLAFKMFDIMLRQEGLDTKMETALTVFKALSKKLKRNYKKQKTLIDKCRAEQLKTLAEQQDHLVELYAQIGIKIDFI